MTDEPTPDSAGRQGKAPDDSSKPTATVISHLRHGVANSLQLLVSLMRLRIMAVADEAMRKELDELASRVLGMATVYRALEVRDDQMRVAVHRVLNDLCDQRRSSLWPPTAQLLCNAEELLMPLEDAMSLTMLTSEIITAAIRRDRQVKGAIIDVRLVHRVGEAIRLEIVDDGFRLPLKPEREAGGTLGWQTVSAMAHQIGATIERSADDRCITLILNPGRLA